MSLRPIQARPSGVHPAAPWILTILAILIWGFLDRPGWDVAVTYDAVREVAAGRDPYADGVARLSRYHEAARRSQSSDPPFIYVYPPVTLPLLNAVDKLPHWLSHSLYWLAYILSSITLLWVGFQIIEPEERTGLTYLAPLAVFFPGLLVNGTILSGNVAIILYAAILLAAVCGWRRGRWNWLYLATVAAACIKPPFLIFALVPLLSSRRQYIRMAFTVAGTIAIIVFQAFTWPTLCRHYLQAVDLMFRYSQDFGSSPAGLLGDFLNKRGLPYQPASLVFYAAYATPLLAILIVLSRKFLDGQFSIERWVPVMLVGLTLLNPRIIDYDAAPATIPIGLIAWRSLNSFNPKRPRLLGLCTLLVLANFVAAHSWELRKIIEGAIIPLSFAAGCLDLIQASRTSIKPWSIDDTNLVRLNHQL